MQQARTFLFSSALLYCLFICPIFCHAEIDAKAYTKNSQVQWAWAILSLDNIDISEDHCILDLGCGDGKLSAYLSKQVPHGFVTGIEPLDKGIESAMEDFPPSHFPNLNFTVADATQLNLEQKFDLITSFCCFNWIEDKASALQCAYNVLHSGGQMLIVVPTMTRPIPAARGFFSRFQENRWKPYIHLFRRLPPLSIADWTLLAESQGFTVEKIKAIKTHEVFHDQQEMRQWLYAIKPELFELPLSLQEEYFEAYHELVRNAYPQAEDGRIYAFPERLEIVLQKP